MTLVTRLDLHSCLKIFPTRMILSDFAQSKGKNDALSTPTSQVAAFGGSLPLPATAHLGE